MPSLGNDLVKIRTHLGYTIEDIQNATKIPLHTLQSIEDNSIFSQTDEIQTYVRSFVRTYGRALKLDDELVVQALDQEEIGSYSHLLLTVFPELAAEISDSEKPETESEESPEEPEGLSDKEKSEAETEEDTGPRFTPDFDNIEPEPEPKTIKQTRAPNQDPGLRDVNWADMGRKMSADRPTIPVWVIGGAVILIVVIASFWFFSQTEMFSSEDVADGDVPTATETTPSTVNGGELNLDLQQNGEEATEEPEQPAALEETLYLTVYAATGNLDPVRVWSDLKPRMDPYWMDQGVAFNFEFRDTIRVRGPYSQILLFLNGHSIDNFRQDYFNSEENAVELTRGMFEEEARWANTVPFELPPDVSEPDSIANRPAF